MADYSNLSNLFNSQKRMDAYNRIIANNKKNIKSSDEDLKLVDMNNNGKIDASEKKAIKDDLNKAQKAKTFDFDSDKKVDINDWLLFVDEMDLDSDGTVSEEEKAFLAKQKTNMKKEVEQSIKKYRYTGVFENTMYNKGSKVSGVFQDEETGELIYYKNGVPAAGKVGDVYYGPDGKKVPDGLDEKSNLYYQDGKLLTGLDSEGIMRKSGKAYCGNMKDSDGNTVHYVDGKVIADGIDERTNLYYQGGKPLTGQDAEGLMRKDGKVFTGEMKDENGTTIYYKDGLKFDGDRKFYNYNSKGAVVSYNVVKYMLGVPLTGLNNCSEDADGLMYKNGKVLTGVHTDENGVQTYYENGKPASGKSGSTYFGDDGKLIADGLNEKDNLYYQGGKPLTGQDTEGLMRKDGKIFTGEMKDENGTTIYYKDGLKFDGDRKFSITDNKGRIIGYNVVKYMLGVPLTGLNNCSEDADGLMYKNGKVLTGVYTDENGVQTYYKNGKPASGKSGSTYFGDDGKLIADGLNEKDNLYYQGGKPLTGQDTEGLMRKDGKVFTGEMKDENGTTIYYKDGLKFDGDRKFSITDNKGRIIGYNVVKYMLGVPLTGLNNCSEDADGLMYKNGKVLTGVYTDEDGVQTYYKNGKPASGKVGNVSFGPDGKRI